MEDTELDRVGRPPTEEDQAPLGVQKEAVGESEREESIEEGGGGGGGPKSVEWLEVVGEGRVTRVRREVMDEMDPFEVEELMYEESRVEDGATGSVEGEGRG